MLSVAEKNVFYALIVTAMVGLTGMKVGIKENLSTWSVKSVNVKYSGKYEPHRINGLRI